MTIQIIQGDCLEVMRRMEPASVDLVFTSPPYEAARTYGIDFTLKGQEFVDWCVERYLECLRVSKGLVAWVIEGQTRKFKYSASPILLMADLHRRGVCLRKPPIFHRIGTAGGGGQKHQHSKNGGSADWLRNDYEFVVCATNGGKLPWADALAMGKPPKYAPGGEMSYRLTDGTRVNQWSATGSPNARNKDGVRASRALKPSHKICGKSRRANGEMKANGYEPPSIANPGNVIKCNVGGGLMGHDLAHENEAPFPESLAEFFIRSFCPPGGTVLDPFSGSGTTVAVAKRCQRCGIGIDIRESQVELAKRRIATVQTELIT